MYALGLAVEIGMCWLDGPKAINECLNKLSVHSSDQIYSYKPIIMHPATHVRYGISSRQCSQSAVLAGSVEQADGEGGEELADCSICTSEAAIVVTSDLQSEGTTCSIKLKATRKIIKRNTRCLLLSGDP